MAPNDTIRAHEISPVGRRAASEHKYTHTLIIGARGVTTHLYQFGRHRFVFRGASRDRRVFVPLHGGGP